MRILHWLLLGILLAPLVELYFLIKVGGVLGPIPTILLVVFTAVVGVALMRQQGFTTLARVRYGMARGEVPAMEMLEGVIILACGILLLFPGFLTDALGFLGLIPPVRRAVVQLALARAVVRVQTPARRPGEGPRVIEGEFRREDDR
jgi:UPF0716 protein FxsA